MSGILSKSDKEALDLLPSDCWFGVDEVSYKIRCPRFRLDRLEQKGMLESRVDGDYSNLKTMWFKKG